MEPQTETLEGYVVDQACIRKYPRDELHERAHEHTTRCALMGHCMESGYGLIGEGGRLALLDAPATAEVVRALRQTGTERGVRLRVRREMREGEMHTTEVEKI